jgi:hypothetical protein
MLIKRVSNPAERQDVDRIAVSTGKTRIGVPQVPFTVSPPLVGFLEDGARPIDEQAQHSMGNQPLGALRMEY